VLRSAIGHIVRHRKYAFCAAVFDGDPVFAHAEEWWKSLPENVRPDKDQPLLSARENPEIEYVAYVLEQNHVADGEPIYYPLSRGIAHPRRKFRLSDQARAIKLNSIAAKLPNFG
jgi:heat shock protein HspQ